MGTIKSDVLKIDDDLDGLLEDEDVEEDVVEDIVEEGEEYLDDEEEVKEKYKPPKGNMVKRKKDYFLVTLKEGTSYKLGGMTFYRGVPTKVDMKKLTKFKDNGWFSVSM